MGIERRRYPRLEERLEVEVLNLGDDPKISAFEAIVPGVAVDISQRGLRLRSGYRVDEGTMVGAIVYYDGQGSICLGEVVWTRDEGEQRVYGILIREWSRLDAALERHLAPLAAQQLAA